MGRLVALAAVVGILAGAAPAATQSEPDLARVFRAFLQTADVRIDAVPDLYPGGYARISIYARKASLGGMRVDEVWFRLVGVSLDPQALARGELRVLDTRDSAMHGRFLLKSLEEYFLAGNAFKDIRLWSDGEYLYGEGTVPINGVPVKVWLKGFFATGGTKDVYFYIDNMRMNGLPVLSPVIRTLEARYNPIFTQATWPVTFKIRSIKLTREMFVVSSQADPNAPCAFCTGGEMTTVAP